MNAVDRWTGVYRIIDDGADIGTEAWTREVGQDEIRLTSVINRINQDVDLEEELDITLTADGQPVSVNIERESQDGIRRYIGRRVGNAWISQVFRESGQMRTITLEFDDETHVDCFTAHTNSITIQRLGLEVGEGQEIVVVFVDPDSYNPSLVHQQYSRLSDPEPFEVAGHEAGHAYRYQGASGVEYTIWTDKNGLVLRDEDLFEAVEMTGV
jgi:hypothetical protein